MIKLTENNFKFYALAALAIHAMIWIALPLLLDGSIRRDVAEGVADGPLWQIAYLRHPPLSSWLSGIASLSGPYRYFVLHFFSAALAGGAFYTLGWFLNKTINPEIGLIALLTGLLSPFGTYIPINLNHNISSLPFWALSMATIWFAFERNKIWNWVSVGIVVGLSLWAKYAIFQLLVPIAIFSMWQQDWRKKLFHFGPWLSLLIGILIVSPQVYHYVTSQSSALGFVLQRETKILSLEQGRFLGEYFLNVLTIQLSFLLLPIAYCGKKIFSNASSSISNFSKIDRLGQYLIVSSIGPFIVILIFALLGRRPGFLWLTTLSVPFIAYWAYSAHQTAKAHMKSMRRLLIITLALMVFNSFAFIAVRFIAPITSRVLSNQEIDSPKLASLALNYWKSVDGGDIPFIVSIGPETQNGFQRASSIVFDLPYRVNILLDGDPRFTPWLDLEPLKKRGALIVSQMPIPETFTVLGQNVVDRQEFDIPMLRNAKKSKIYFARSVPIDAED